MNNIEETIYEIALTESEMECDALNTLLKERDTQLEELKAYIERLREALNNALTHCIDNDVNTDRFNQMISEALEETPAQTLNHIKAQVEEETIERCAVQGWSHFMEAPNHKKMSHSAYDGFCSAFSIRSMPRKYKEQSDEEYQSDIQSASGGMTQTPIE